VASGERPFVRWERIQDKRVASGACHGGLLEILAGEGGKRYFFALTARNMAC